MLVPVYDRPSVAEPTETQDRAVMESRSATIHRKMPIPARQLPITESAHKAGNGRRPLPAATGIARSARRAARAQWLADREAELLPVPYFHVVFTLPAAIAAIAFQNKRAVYDILFSAAAETLAHHRRRPSASRRRDRPHRRAAHLGPDAHPSSARPLSSCPAAGSRWTARDGSPLAPTSSCTLTCWRVCSAARCWPCSPMRATPAN